MPPPAIFPARFDSDPLEVSVPPMDFSAVFTASSTPELVREPEKILLACFVRLPVRLEIAPERALDVCFDAEPELVSVPDRDLFACLVALPEEVRVPARSFMKILAVARVPVMDEIAPESVLFACFESVPTIEDKAPLKDLLVNLLAVPEGVTEPERGLLPCFAVAPLGVIEPEADWLNWVPAAGGLKAIEIDASALLLWEVTVVVP